MDTAYPSVTYSDVVSHLEHHSKGRPEKYHTFWDYCWKVNEECSALIGCHNGEMPFFSAMSVSDLVDKLVSTYPGKLAYLTQCEYSQS